MSSSLYGPPHPIPERLHRPVSVDASISLDAPLDSNRSVLVRDLLAAKPRFSLGVLEGPEEYVLGRIQGIEIDTGGQIFVLDAGDKKVRVFSPTGQYVTSFGQPGSGPGEFVDPKDLVLKDSNAYVVDLGKIHVFARSANGYSYKQLIIPRFEVLQLCATENDLLVHGIKSTSEKLVFSMMYPHVAFGQVYSRLSPVGASHLNRSRLACPEHQGIVVLAPTSVLGELHAYRTTGEALWITSIKGYRPIDFRETAQGGTRTMIPSGGYDRVSAVVNAPTGEILVQVLYTSFEDYNARVRDYTSLFTFVVDKNGQPTSAGNSLPQILAIGKRIAAMYRQDPFPQVTVYAW